MKKPLLFLPVTSLEELRDKSSWVYTGLNYPQERYDEICIAIGESMLAWSMLEGQLYATFCFSTLPPSPEVCSALWMSTQGFRSKLKMTDNALQACSYCVFDQDRWNNLREKCRKKSLRRNIIAHGSVGYDHKCKPGRKFFLKSSIDNINDKERLHCSDLNSIRDAFCRITDELRKFNQDLSAASNTSLERARATAHEIGKSSKPE